MRTAWCSVSVVLLSCVLFGCGREQENRSQQPDQDAVMGEPARTIAVTGFDPEGEPVIEVLRDGTLRVMFEFMPPSYAEDESDLGPFEDFDKQMQDAIGVPVSWDDREVFLIRNPKPDTVERLQQFLQNYRQNSDPDRAPMEQQ